MDAAKAILGFSHNLARSTLAARPQLQRTAFDWSPLLIFGLAQASVMIALVHPDREHGLVLREASVPVEIGNALRQFISAGLEVADAGCAAAAVAQHQTGNGTLVVAVQPEDARLSLWSLPAGECFAGGLELAALRFGPTDEINERGRRTHVKRLTVTQSSTVH